MLKLTCISDTHKKHRQIEIPKCDILVHAGDLGFEKQIDEDFFQWYSEQPARYKLFLQGNHDIQGQEYEYLIKQKAEKYDLIYMHHNAIELEGLKFYGSNYSPRFGSWAWMKSRGLSMEQEWSQIPDNTQILLTHGPAYGILDTTAYGEKAGCEQLRDRIKNLTELKILIAGHIHEQYGICRKFGVDFVNAAMVDMYNRLVNKPIILNL
jgi:Icc-related predicted phosphoesterase